MDIYQHINLLQRYDRTAGIIAGLREFVKEKDVLLDAGCGSGIVSFLALQLGAAHICAVERDPVIDLAARIAADNGYRERIDFLRRDLDDLLPADINYPLDGIIAFVYLNDPRRDEDRHRLLDDLRGRLSLEDAKIFPNKVHYSAGLVNLPGYDIANHQAEAAVTVQRLERRYRLNLDALTEGIAGSIDYSFFPRRSEKGDYSGEPRTLLSDISRWTEIDYTRPDNPPYPAQLHFTLTRDGRPNAVIWTQELYYNDILIFGNEAVSYLRNTALLKEGQEITVALDDTWRKSNILSIGT